MAFKIYKSENYFIINDTSTGDDVLRQVRDNVRWEKKDSKYSFFLKSNLLLKNEDQFVKGSKDLKQLPFSNIYGPIDFADTVDSTGTAWASESALDTFLNKWTGYIHLETIGADASYNVVNSTPTVLASGTIASGSSADISIPDITFTDSDGTPSTVPAGVDIVATACSLAPTYATADVMKTGQTTSQVTYDDGYNEFGRLVDFFTLAENNIFGNTNRFTDTLGGSTYADGIRLDHSTYNGTSRLAWYTGNYTTNGATLANACLNSYADSHGGFAHWFVPNKKQMESILYNGGASGVKLLNYAPFNINLADDFWTNTNTPITPTTAVYVYQNYNYCIVTNGNMSYAAGKHVPCRYILDSEL